MDHLKALTIKGVMTFAVLLVILGFVFNVSLIDVLILTAVVGGLSYPIGDLNIFPKTGNSMATITDFVLVFAVVFGYGLALTNHMVSLVQAGILTAAVLALGEWFFHKHIAKLVLHKKRPFQLHNY
ncbi:DUF2512 family protein [Thalassobacillus pellis]|uniref:DUF2512 family protein n=1 Tax=Thalassobacillus pellis TaxID=748008 RepID=UPI001961B775|nr:DUF2512 family protein [Thalassobacillus pellis]MBM7552003.1 putative RND superfamily exporter protein [Thalassobacillus pellis]